MVLRPQAAQAIVGMAFGPDFSGLFEKIRRKTAECEAVEDRLCYLLDQIRRLLNNNIKIIKEDGSPELLEQLSYWLAGCVDDSISSVRVRFGMSGLVGDVLGKIKSYYAKTITIPALVEELNRLIKLYSTTYDDVMEKRDELRKVVGKCNLQASIMLSRSGEVAQMGHMTDGIGVELAESRSNTFKTPEFRELIKPAQIQSSPARSD